MTRTLYALLVGIDAYPSPVPPLKGCVNDVTAFESYLQGRTAGGEFNLRIQKLTDQAATRQAVMDGFLKHLSQAGAEDVALFYYSGHGSQEIAPREFWDLEPDHRNETLVCWDSRQQGGWDLADKELAHLIHQVARNNPHLVIILDCCHSGSGTRDAYPTQDVRWAPVDVRPRPLETYFFAPEILAGQRDVQKSGWLALPQGRHVLLAACRSDQKAREYRADEKTWGAFSYFLRTTLEDASGEMTYRDLFKQAQTRVRASVQDQSPQLEAHSMDDFDQTFLGGAVRPRPQYFTASHTSAGWVLDAGAVHGIAVPQGGEATNLALFPVDTPAEMLSDLAQAVATAAVTAVFAAESRLNILQGEAQLNPQRTYKALVTALPMPPLGVQLDGDADGLAFVRQALAGSAPGGAASLYVQEAGQGARLRLLTRDGMYTITYPDQERPLVGRIAGYGVAAAGQTVSRLEHIARWLRTIELRNPASQLTAGAVRMWVTQPDASGEIGPDELLFSYRRLDGQWVEPSYDLHLENTSNRVLYVTVLGLGESFSIDVLFSFYSLPPVVRLAAGESFKLRLTGSVPEDVWRQGVTDRQDILKLIASTDEFDASLLSQGRLDSPHDRTNRSLSLAAGSNLQRLMRQVQMREFTSPGAATSYSDWITAQLAVTHRRPLEGLPVPRSGVPVLLGAGVRLEPHPALEARARIADVPPASRDAALPELPELLSGNLPGSQPFVFRVTRGMTAENMLELRDVADHTVVTPQAPLRLHLPEPLQPTESVLAYGYDGEFFLPLGASRTDGYESYVDLQHLPQPISTGRDLGGAVRIFFQKITHDTIGLPYEYPVLTAAEAGPGGRVTLQADPEKIRALLGPATHATLFIHGFTGDTRGMLATARQYLKDDVVLAFDYESINTSVEETARKLKRRLEAVGLGVGHGKRLRIIAHSLGGILARYLVEQVEGGKEIVQQVVILGSPSAGTPWPSVQRYAILGISLALNGLTAVAWPVKALGWMLNAFESVDVTLDEIQFGAELLKTLQDSDDPHVPYILIAGDTSIIPAALDGQEKSRMARLLQRLGYSLASLPFFGESNDIAVGVRSVHNVPDRRDPAPQKVTIACDHITFFEPGVGLETLRQLLG